MNPIDSSELMKARDRLLQGEVVGMPTETVYGLAASIESEAGLRRIFSLKERPFFDPLIVHVASFKDAASLVKEWPPLADFLARVFWPGPFTIVLPKASHVNSLITSGLETVALRFPSHPVAQDLIKIAGVPLAAPSANKFGRTSPSRAEHVKAEFPDTDLLIIDGGECEVGLESTVVSVTEADGQGEVLILRPGAVTGEMIQEALKRWSKPVTVRRAQSEASPGHLKHHYMPKIPLVIVKSDEPHGLSPATKQRIAAELKANEPQSPAELVLDSDPAIAARELYSQMREKAESGADALYVRHSAHPEGLWAAIWDRLTRAASLDLSSS